MWGLSDNCNTQLWKEMSRSSRSPSSPAACLAQPHPAIEHQSPWEPLSSLAWELFPGPPSLSSPRHSCTSHGSWQYEDFGRQLGGSGRLHAHYWKHTFALLLGTRQMSAESGCEKSPQQSKILHILSVFVQSRNTFAQSLSIESGSLYISQKVTFSTHWLPLFIYSLHYLLSLNFQITFLRWQGTMTCLSKFLFCCRCVKSSSSWLVVCHSELKVQQPPVSHLSLFWIERVL